MARKFSPSTGSKRLIAVVGVLLLALTVPPAFGAPSMTKQVARALKLATKANTNAAAAKVTAAKALNAAQAQAAGTAGPAGPKGATGAAGPAGATGASGAKGDKGDTGATGVQGPQGPAGAGGSGGSSGAPNALSDSVITDPSAAVLAGKVQLTTSFVTELSVQPKASSAYVINAHVGVMNVSGASSSSMTCELRSGSTVLDRGTVTHLYGNYQSNVALTGLATSDIVPEAITADCSSPDNGLWVTTRSLTAVNVTAPPTTP